MQSLWNPLEVHESAGRGWRTAEALKAEVDCAVLGTEQDEGAGEISEELRAEVRLAKPVKHRFALLDFLS
jgi:hypothetical protein